VKKIAAFALVALVLTACSSPEKQAEQAQKFVHNEANLVDAQRNAAVDCDAANCDAAWALTKRYIVQRSDTSITRADAVAIDTEVPSGSGKASFSATRAAKGSDYDKCADKILKTQNGYVAFLRAHASGQ